MDYSSLRGKTALITGASARLGADFARVLAGHGCHLILVARRVDKLEELRREIAAKHSVDTTVISLDLALPNAAQTLYDRTKTLEKEVNILVNNAGFGLHGDFAETLSERECDLLQLNIVTLTHLTKLYLPEMLARNEGHILLVASNGAYTPTPTFAVYGASKAYVLSFGEALHEELAGTNVNCTVFAPGYTATEFQEVAGVPIGFWPRLTMMESADIPRAGIDGMVQRRMSFLPGFVNSASVLATRVLPRRWNTALAKRLATLG